MAIQNQEAEHAKPAAPTPLQQLVRCLQEAFAAEKDLGVVIDNNQATDFPDSFARLDARVRALFAEYIDGGHDDWKRYEFFEKDHYVRNLVEGNQDFELMVICWDSDQVSRIHDHQGAHGYVTILDGAVEEKRFTIARKLERRDSTPAESPRLPGMISALAPCPQLVEIGAGVARRGDGTIYINDHIALHSVGCAPGSEGPAVTLHLYAPPVRRVQLFEPEENRVLERKPGFHTVHGERV